MFSFKSVLYSTYSIFPLHRNGSELHLEMEHIIDPTRNQKPSTVLLQHNKQNNFHSVVKRKTINDKTAKHVQENTAKELIKCSNNTVCDILQLVQILKSIGFERSKRCAFRFEG